MQTISVMQLVDNLTLGGMETVALNLANDIAAQPGFESYLVCGRTEGELNKRIHPGVQYLFLNRKRNLDVKALRHLHTFISKYNIGIIHAHGTAFSLAVLLKPYHHFKLIWHDHYGLQVPENGKRFYPYIFFSRFFDFAISVNHHLLESNKRHLHITPSHQIYLPNYSVRLLVTKMLAMEGIKEQRLVCLANLRRQKDHFTLLHAFRQVKDAYPNAFLYCLGICEGDAYETEVRQLQKDLNLENSVFFTGSVENPFQYLEQAAIGILSSTSEGLPLSLIEYGLANLPVVCTNVGQCAELLQNGKNGLLVPPQDATALAAACLQLLHDKKLGDSYAVGFAAFIRNHYSKEAILHRLVSIYKSLT